MVKKIPDRMCISCREMKPKKELLRIVSDKEGNIFLDTTGRANGRGAYICKSDECILKAKKIKALERTFKRQMPEDIWEKTGMTGK